MVRAKAFLKALASVVLVAAILVMAFSPYVLVELYGLANDGVQPIPDNSEDDSYWKVEKIAPGVFAIGEPEFYQLNWHYLIVGRDQAVLFDTGTGLRGIKSTVEALTDLPVTAMVSHLHYDHVGNLHQFDQVIMIDVPSVRASVAGDTLHIGRYQHLGFLDGLDVRPANVSGWITDGAAIDLGDRVLSVYSVPGHTPDSIVLHDPVNNLLFMGDTLYPGQLLALLPGASRSDYAASAGKLIDTVPDGTKLLAGHAAGTAPLQVPVMPLSSLASLKFRLAAAEAGEIDYAGFFPRILEIEPGISFVTGFSWANR